MLTCLRTFTCCLSYVVSFLTTIFNSHERLVFDDDIRNMSGEFCDELNDCFLELFQSSMDTSVSQRVDVDEYDDVAKVNYKLSVYVNFLCTIVYDNNLKLQTIIMGQ